MTVFYLSLPIGCLLAVAAGALLASRGLLLF